MTGPSHRASVRFSERLGALSDEHQGSIARFHERLVAFERSGLLSHDQQCIVSEHLLRLGERRRNPANTGNIEDLFCHTLTDTKDCIRAFAQALADSVKVVPMDEAAPLFPAMKRLDGSKRYEKVADFDHLSPGDKMLVSHTMVAYGDPEMWRSAVALVKVTHPHLDDRGVDREVAKMAVQSQHLPSSTFVLARAAGLTIDCAPLYERAGYDAIAAKNAQRFYDVCAEFEPSWAAAFLEGRAPTGAGWDAWRVQYLATRALLPEELIYQLSSDTLTNFHDATLESGKWTDASVFFGGVTSSSEVTDSIARIVNQYIAEHVALHDRPAAELTEAWTRVLEPWGIGFQNDRAVVLDRNPEKRDQVVAQFEEAWSRKNQ